MTPLNAENPPATNQGVPNNHSLHRESTNSTSRLRLVRMSDMPMPTADEVAAAWQRKQDWNRDNDTMTPDEVLTAFENLTGNLNTTSLHAELYPNLYSDIAGLLDGTLPEPPRPDILTRADGHRLFYFGELNLLYGDPADGKTWVALAAQVEILLRGGSGLFIDLDGNGAIATVRRMLALGAPPQILADPNRFRHTQPADTAELAAVISDAAHEWAPAVVVLDCVGELMALRGGSSDSDTDFTAAINETVAPLVRAGACIILIDHLAKGRDSRSYGAGGTMAKKRKIGGASIQTAPIRKLAPGHGGAIRLIIKKDRHGGVVEHAGVAEDAGTFVLNETPEGVTSWRVEAPGSQHEVPSRAAGESLSANAKKHIQSARKLTNTAGDFTAADLAGLVCGHPYTEAQTRAARRACDELVKAELATVANLGDGTMRDPRRWRAGAIAATGETANDADE